MLKKIAFIGMIILITIYLLGIIMTHTTSPLDMAKIIELKTMVLNLTYRFMLQHEQQLALFSQNIIIHNIHRFHYNRLKMHPTE